MKVTDVHCFAKVSIKTPASLFLNMTVPLYSSVARLTGSLIKATKTQCSEKYIQSLQRKIKSLTKR